MPPTVALTDRIGAAVDGAQAIDPALVDWTAIAADGRRRGAVDSTPARRRA